MPVETPTAVYIVAYNPVIWAVPVAKVVPVLVPDYHDDVYDFDHVPDDDVY